MECEGGVCVQALKEKTMDTLDELSFGIFKDEAVLMKVMGSRTSITLALLRQLACGVERFTQTDFAPAVDALEKDGEFLLLLSRLDHSLLPQNLMMFWIGLLSAANEEGFNGWAAMKNISSSSLAALCFAGH